MKLSPLGPWPLDPGRKFPHMSEQDSLVWRNFLLNYQSVTGEYLADYDVQVALKGDESDGVLEPFNAMWQTLRAKRIDVVLSSPSQWVLVEVKPTFTFSGVGQLLGYKYWFQRTFDVKLPIALWAVAHRFDRDVLPLLDEHGIVFYLST